MMATTQGRRVEPDVNGNVPYESLQAGDYVRWEAQGAWWLVTPNGHHGMIKPDIHKIEIEEDGTITVSPSIRLTGTAGVELWHGFLKHGVWTDA